jgi:hypothetical protein
MQKICLAWWRGVGGDNDVPVRGEVMAVVLRPGLRCRGKGEDEHRQDRGGADIGGRRPAIAATKRIELGSLLRERNATERPCVIVPRDAEGLCFRVGIATPLAVERLQTQKVDFDVGQIHRGLHYTTAISPYREGFSTIAGGERAQEAGESTSLNCCCLLCAAGAGTAPSYPYWHEVRETWRAGRRRLRRKSRQEASERSNSAQAKDDGAGRLDASRKANVPIVAAPLVRRSREIVHDL